MGKLYDLGVVVGSYTTGQGEEKKRWKTIGSVIETKDGGKVILIDRTFNPAGVPVEPGRDSVMVSMFKPRDKDDQQPAPSQHQQQKQNGYAPQQNTQRDGFEDIGNDIPF
jgi:hypothetical protein